MQVVVEVLTVDVAEVVGDRGVALDPLQVLQRLLDLLLSALLLVGSDDRLPGLEVLLLAPVQVRRKRLVELRDLLAEISGS